MKSSTFRSRWPRRSDSKASLILRLLSDGEPHRFSDIARAIGARPVATGNSIQSLLANGEIVRIDRGIYCIADAAHCEAPAWRDVAPRQPALPVVVNCPFAERRPQVLHGRYILPEVPRLRDVIPFHCNMEVLS